MKDDFKLFGFSDEKVKDMMKVKEPATDACGQIPNGTASQRKHELALEKESFINRATRERQRRDKDKNSPEGKKMGRGYEPLPIEGTENWVLLDVNRGFPPTLPGDPPEIFVRLSRYVPGNRKIIAYNTKSHSVGLRKVPSNFEGCTVEYHKNGPKLVKVLDEKLIKKRGVKQNVEPQEPSPPSKKRRAQPEEELENNELAENTSPPKKKRGTRVTTEPQAPAPPSRKRRAQPEEELDNTGEAQKPSPPKKRRTRAKAEPKEPSPPSKDQSTRPEELISNKELEHPAPPKPRRGKARALGNDSNADSLLPPKEGLKDHAKTVDTLVITEEDTITVQKPTPPSQKPSLPSEKPSPSSEKSSPPSEKPSPPAKRRAKGRGAGTAGASDNGQHEKKPSPPRRSKRKSDEMDKEAGTPSPDGNVAPTKKRRSARLTTEPEIKKETEDKKEIEEAVDSAVATPADEESI